MECNPRPGWPEYLFIFLTGHHHDAIQENDDKEDTLFVHTVEGPLLLWDLIC
jgi:hypothetical protein